MLLGVAIFTLERVSFILAIITFRLLYLPMDSASVVPSRYDTLVYQSRGKTIAVKGNGIVISMAYTGTRDDIVIQDAVNATPSGGILILGAFVYKCGANLPKIHIP